MRLIRWLRLLWCDLVHGDPPWHSELEGAEARHRLAIENFSSASERSRSASDRLQDRTMRTRVVAEGVLRRVGGKV